MKAHDIFQQLPESFAGDVFQFLYDNDKPAYRACVQVLSTRRKLRPVILERKSREERHLWMRNEITRKANEDASIEILQTWLLGAHKSMICQFLDSLKIPHNGHGLIDDLPAEPSEAAVTEAVEGLLKDYPRDAVAAYLNLFIEMDVAQWPTLEKILASDSRLCLAPQTSAA